MPLKVHVQGSRTPHTYDKGLLAAYLLFLPLYRCSDELAGSGLKDIFYAKDIPVGLPYTAIKCVQAPAFVSASCLSIRHSLAYFTRATSRPPWVACIGNPLTTVEVYSRSILKPPAVLSATSTRIRRDHPYCHTRRDYMRPKI